MRNISLNIIKENKMKNTTLKIIGKEKVCGCIGGCI
jgi:hypothetical protein